MPERRVTVAAPEGLHARPAAVFVKAATGTGTPVTIARPDGGEPADARSILAVLALDVRHGEQVLLRAEGAGAEAALDRLARLLAGTGDAGETGTGGAGATGTGGAGATGTGGAAEPGGDG